MSATERAALQLLMPAAAWDPADGFAAARESLRRAAADGVGGFVFGGGVFGGGVFGGGALDALRDLVSELASAGEPLLLARATWGGAVAAAPAPSTGSGGAAAERAASLAGRGSGGAASVGSNLPPPAAIESLRDPLAIRAVASAAAHAARAVGFNLLLGPRCDVAATPRACAFGSDASRVAEAVAEWIDTCLAEGVLCCADDFPGTGRVAPDDCGVPVVDAGDDALYSVDLVPFRAAIDAGIAAVRTAAASYPSLDPSSAPAVLSPRIQRGLLRGELGFDGLIVADAGETSARVGRRVSAAELVAAGADLVISPTPVVMERRSFAEALRDRWLDAERVEEAAVRRRRWAALASPPVGAAVAPPRTAASLVDEVAERAVCVVRGRAVRVRQPVQVVPVAGPAAHDAARALAAGLSDAAGEPLDVRHGGPSGTARTPLVLVVADAADRPPGDAVVARVAALCATGQAAARDVVAVWCGHPDLAGPLAHPDAVIACWDAGDTMLRAAGRWLVRRT